MKPRVSVLVATKDRAEFLKGCLDSLVSQTIVDRTEIIVLDGSVKKADRAIVKAYQTKYPQIKYKFIKKPGLYHAWNRGIKASSGKYISNLNTDDRLSKKALEVMANALDRNPKVALVYGDSYTTPKPNDSFRKRKSREWKKAHGLNYSLKNIHLYCLCGPHPMWRKKIHRELGYFDESFKMAGDYEFWLRIAQKYPMLRVPKYVGLFYQNPKSLSLSNPGLHYQERARIKKKYFN